jgi:hypothetical protein
MKIPFYLTQLLALGQALKIGQNSTSAVQSHANATSNVTANMTRPSDESSFIWAEVKIESPKGDKSVWTKIKHQGFK